MKKRVWNVKTGGSVEVEGVDAREYVSSGGWSFDPLEPPEPETTDSDQLSSESNGYQDGDPLEPPEPETTGKKAKK